MSRVLHIDVYVENIEDAEGMIALSKDHATKIKVWEVLESALRDGVPVEGKIIGKTKGGFLVDMSGVSAFLPGSQVDIKPLKDIDSLMGKKMPFRVLKLNNKLSNVIVSRRAILEEEMRTKKVETLERLKEGQLMRGFVKISLITVYLLISVE